MNNEQKNETIQSYLEPDACWHEFLKKKRHDTAIHRFYLCDHCGEKFYPNEIKIVNPNYLTMGGIGKIKEFLVQKEKWRELRLFILNKIEAGYADGYTTNDCILLFDIATDPVAFTDKFIEFMEKNK